MYEITEKWNIFNGVNTRFAIYVSTTIVKIKYLKPQVNSDKWNIIRKSKQLIIIIRKQIFYWKKLRK